MEKEQRHAIRRGAGIIQTWLMAYGWVSRLGLRR